MYRVDTRPHNLGRNRPSYSHKRHRKIMKKRPFGRMLENRSEFDEATNTITYRHATRGPQKRFLTPQLSYTLLGS